MLFGSRTTESEADTPVKVKTLPPYPDAEVRVPPGHAWVEGTHAKSKLSFLSSHVYPQGDEYFHSDDSNTFGPVRDVKALCLH